MLESHATRDPLVRLKSHHLSEQVDSILVHVLHVVRHWDALPSGEGGLKVWIFEGLGPVLLIRSTLHLEYFEDLVDFGVAYEQGFPLSHLGIDAADRPDVDGSGVLFSSKEDLGSSVPEGDHLMSVGLDWQSESPG